MSCRLPFRSISAWVSFSAAKHWGGFKEQAIAFLCLCTHALLHLTLPVVSLTLFSRISFLSLSPGAQKLDMSLFCELDLLLPPLGWLKRHLQKNVNLSYAECSFLLPLSKFPALLDSPVQFCAGESEQHRA